MNNELINFRSHPRIYRGHKCYSLYWIAGPLAGQEYLAFKLFTEDLIDDGLSHNSIKNYSIQGAQYLDFMETGYAVLGEINTETTNLLTKGYYDYLIWGSQCEADHLVKIHKVKPRETVSSKSAAAYHAPIKRLINCAANTVDKLESHKVYGHTANLDRSIKLFSSFKSAARSLTHYQKKNLKNRSRLGSVMSGGPQKKQPNILGHLPKNNYDDNDVIDPKKFFPLEHICSLILSAGSYRDAALWALIAASSLRPIEAIQLLREDIDLVRRKVYAIDPYNRPNIPQSYYGITQTEFLELAWKGRATKHTLLLEPYGTLFFTFLEKYWLHEYRIDTGHNFIFQDNDGSPLYLRDYGSCVLRSFHEAASIALKNVDMCEREYLGLHSLRHSYCYYFKNFFQHTHGCGLSNHELMMLTGHQDPKSLEKYAVLDHELLLEKITSGRNHFTHNSPRSEHELMIGFHMDRIEELRKELEMETRRND